MGEMTRTNRDVVKASPAIHIQNNITLLQRRAWNVLLYNAYDNLMEVDVHEMPLKKLCEILDFSSNNQEYLKEALRAMASCTLEWNVLQKDKSADWGVATLLADARIRDGICTYSYGAQFREVLYNPKMYARINLSLQNRFDGKHAQALWELCLDYLGSAREFGETPYIEIATFKKLMGIGEDAYPSYKRLNEKVIKPAVAEINKVSDLQVSVDSQRRGRKITALKFKIRRVTLLTAANGKQSSLFPELEDMPVPVKLLEEAGLSARDAWEIFQQGFNYVQANRRPTNVDDDPEGAFDQYIREKVHLLKSQEPGKVKHRTAWLVRAIKQNYSHPTFAESKKKEAQAQTVQAEHLRGRQYKSLEDEKGRLEQERDEAIHALCGPILEEKLELVDELTQAVLKAEPHYRRLYEPHLTAFENYQVHRFLALLVDERLVKRFPRRFKTLNEKYQAKLGDIDRRIAALGAEVA